jgi:predicted alpha-1,2-mannosidase
MRKISLLLGIILLSCSRPQESILKNVNPLLGTDLAGNTSPAACVPFGMVQLGPDTRLENWEGSSGYHHRDTVILGFTHTHISGAGVSAWGDVLFMPMTGKAILDRGDIGKSIKGYSSPFSKASEDVHPGYYSVTLGHDSIKVELTATERAGFHCYHFPATDSANVVIDLTHRDINRQSYIKIISDNEIEGYRHTLGLADHHYTFFYAKFSKPILQYVIAANDSVIKGSSCTNEKIKSYLRFKSDGKEPLYIKIGISQVSCEGAKKNLEAEIKGWNFAKVRSEAEKKWLDKLSRIQVETDSLPLKRIFYSALYHCFLNPQIASDHNGSYRGMDQQIHKAEGFTYYNVYSLWDTYRALHPLFTIIDTKTNYDFIKSILVKFQQKPDRLIKWELASYDWGGMIGYPAIPVLVDAYMKGLRDFDTTLAWQAIKSTTMCDFEGLNSLKNLGFIPCDRLDQSLSRTVEMSYEDWTASQMAKAMGKTTDYKYYLQRSKFYKNIYDPSTQLMRPRFANGNWIEPFITDRYTPDITESSATQYSCYAMHDMYSWINLLGGNEQAEKWLDKFFDASGNKQGRMIGFYEQGNEPTHHAAYEYNYLGKPWKTQKLIRDIFNMNFNDKADGLPGNDDCGQMSAWIVMSAMGIYPFCPGLPQYTIGEPMFKKVTIKLENEKTFEINAPGTSDRNKYIQSETLNQQFFSKNYIDHSAIVSGGSLNFVMGPAPNKNLGSAKSEIPCYFDSEIKQSDIPFINPSDYYFGEKAFITLIPSDKTSQIKYTTDGSEPTEKSAIYYAPFEINKTTVVKARAFNQGMQPSMVVSDTIKKAVMHEALKVELKNAEVLVPGLKFRLYFISTTHLPEFNKMKPTKEGIVQQIGIDISPLKDYFALEFEGLLKVPQNGIYTFGILSDDGSRLIIDNTQVAILDFGHPAIERKGKIGLKKGYHAFKLQYYENCGGQSLDINWEGPGIKKQRVPSDVFFQPKK